MTESQRVLETLRELLDRFDSENGTDAMLALLDEIGREIELWEKAIKGETEGDE